MNRNRTPLMVEWMEDLIHRLEKNQCVGGRMKIEFEMNNSAFQGTKSSLVMWISYIPYYLVSSDLLDPLYCRWGLNV